MSVTLVVVCLLELFANFQILCSRFVFWGLLVTRYWHQIHLNFLMYAQHEISRPLGVVLLFSDRRDSAHRVKYMLTYQTFFLPHYYG